MRASYGLETGKSTREELRSTVSALGNGLLCEYYSATKRPKNITLKGKPCWKVQLSNLQARCNQFTYSHLKRRFYFIKAFHTRSDKQKAEAAFVLLSR